MNIILGKLVFVSVSILLVWNILSMVSHHNIHHNVHSKSKGKFVDRYMEFAQREAEENAEIDSKIQNSESLEIQEKSSRETVKLQTATTTTTTTTTTTEKTVISEESFLDVAKNAKGKINVYRYVDICHDYDNYATKWNTLFPLFPATAGVRPNFLDETPLLEGGFSRRMIGFLHPEKSDWYSFLAEGRMGCEVRLIEGSFFPKNAIYNNFLLSFSIQKDQILKEDDKKEPYKAFKEHSKSAFLHKDKSYMIDVLHAVPAYGFLNLKWKTKDEREYTKIPNRMLTALYSKPSVTDKLPNITYNMEYTSRTEYMQQDRRIFFYQTQTIDLTNSTSVPATLEECDYTASYIPDKFPPDHGVAYVQVDKVYPVNLLIKHHIKGGVYDLFMNNEDAQKVADKVMDLLGRYSKHLQKSYVLILF